MSNGGLSAGTTTLICLVAVPAALGHPWIGVALAVVVIAGIVVAPFTGVLLVIAGVIANVFLILPTRAAARAIRRRLA